MSGGVAAGLGLAALCALGTNLGWLIKHRGAQRSPRMSHRHPWRSVRLLLTSRAFIAGLAIATAAGLLHIAALALAPISIVQAVMAGGIMILVGRAAGRLARHPTPAIRPDPQRRRAHGSGRDAPIDPRSPQPLLVAHDDGV